MEIYDPLGVFEIKSGKVTGEIAIILPPDLNSSGKKFKVKKLANIDISYSGSKPETETGANGIFLVINVKDSNGNDQRDLSQKTIKSNYAEVKLDMKIETFNAADEKCRMIVFHSNDFEEANYSDLIDCAKEFIKKHKYDTNASFKNYCQEKGINQPDTVGGGILVGTGG